MKKYQIQYYINKYNESGRIAFYYPRLKKIALNGGRMENVNDAIKNIKDCLKNEKSICKNN